MSSPPQAFGSSRAPAVRFPLTPLTTSYHPGIGMLTPGQWSAISARLRLTSREREVAQLLFEGRTRESIARHLDLSTRTVRQYVERLHDKLRVNDRVGLVLRIVRVRDELGQLPQEPSAAGC